MYRALAALLVACNASVQDDGPSFLTDSGTTTDDTTTHTHTTTTTTTTTTDPAGVEVCEATLGIGADTCVATAGTSGATLVRGLVLGPDTTYEGGGVLFDAAGAITCVGCGCEAQDPQATVVDCADGVVTPGLINAHDHISFDQTGPVDHGAERYEHRHDWRLGGDFPVPSNPSPLGSSWAEVRMIVYGTTSVVGSGLGTGLARNLDRSAGNGGLPVLATFDTFPLGDSNGSFKADCGWSFAGLESEVSQFEDMYAPHVAEGIDFYANEEFRCLSDGVVGEDVVESNTAHMNGVGLRAQDYAQMARDGTALIWSPRSNLSLYGHTAQPQVLAAMGGTIAIGTDWTPSGSMTTARELACARDFSRDYLDGAFTDRDLWAMATSGAAKALDLDGSIGSLAVGLLADISVFRLVGDDPYASIIDAEADSAVLVLRGGVAQYGEAAPVEVLRPGCDAVDVCTQARALCVTAEVGTDWAAFSTELASSYPAWACGAPLDEPTCVPSRPGEFDGVPTADDSDGDGLANGADLCPTVFSALRPMDEGAQPDADGDGLGDACDPTPIGTDIDGDGVDNDTDKCLVTPDVSQADADADGKGDACDACPDVPNPDRGCP